MSNLDKKITSATLTSYESFCITITNARTNFQICGAVEYVLPFS